MSDKGFKLSDVCYYCEGCDDAVIAKGEACKDITKVVCPACGAITNLLEDPNEVYN